jgi:glycosyltransferase involved in cell wall biosynthesis
MNKPIRFIDPVNYKEYNSYVLKTQPLGGTEATIVRVSSALSKSHTVEAYQRDCGGHVDPSQVLYRSIDIVDEALKASQGISIVLRSLPYAIALKTHFPNEVVFAWLHDLQSANAELVHQYELCAGLGIELICVSQFHKENASQVRALCHPNKRPKIRVIYNPVMVDKSDGTPTKDKDLVFFSSPHKGLVETVEVFARFREFPELAHFKLKVANPGYFEIPEHIKGRAMVEILGPMPHAQMMMELSNAFAVLHLNSVFPETFGLVHAEAMALGIPVITSHLGANPEILTHPHFMTDVRDIRSVVHKLIDWVKYGAPKARLDNKFSIDNVRKVWEDLINEFIR